MAIRRGDTIVLNSAASLRQRTQRKVGRKHYSIEVKSEPIVHRFDERRLGKTVTEAIKGAIEDDFEKVSHPVKASTLERRQRAVKAAAGVTTSDQLTVKRNAGAIGPRKAKSAKRAKSAGTGKRPKKTGKPSHASKWYRERFMGGKTGHTPPTDSRKWGTDSGRLSKHLVIVENKTDASFGIKTVANRLREDTFEDPKRPGYTFQQFAQDLAKYVPTMGGNPLGPRGLGRNKKVQQAIEASIHELIMVAGDRTAQARRGVSAAQRKLLREIYRAGAIILG